MSVMKLTIPLDGKTVRQSDKAFGIEVNGTLVWLPKSQIEDVQEGDPFSCWCPMWLIEEKGLEIFIDTSHEPGLFQ